MRQITSRENSVIKRFAALSSDKGERGKDNLIAIEGAKLCLDALQSGLSIHEVFVTEKALQKYSGTKELIQKASESFIISESVATKMSDAKTPQGVFAVCGKPLNKRPGCHKRDARYLLLATLQDSGNVGTIIRTVEALGLDGVALTSDCPDLYSPKVLRASMGGVFRLPVWTVLDMQEEILHLKSEGVTVYAAALEPNVEKLRNVQFKDACAVLLGNEGAGLPQNLIEVCDYSVIIPMAGCADSLSVATAASIFAWEMKA